MSKKITGRKEADSMIELWEQRKPACDLQSLRAEMDLSKQKRHREDMSFITLCLKLLKLINKRILN